MARTSTADIKHTVTAGVVCCGRAAAFSLNGQREIATARPLYSRIPLPVPYNCRICDLYIYIYIIGTSDAILGFRTRVSLVAAVLCIIIWKQRTRAHTRTKLSVCQLFYHSAKPSATTVAYTPPSLPPPPPPRDYEENIIHAHTSTYYTCIIVIKQKEIQNDNKIRKRSEE